MVPGMIERERRAADARRADWLADAAGGSRRASGSRVRFDANTAVPRVRRRQNQHLRSVVARLIGSAAARFRRIPHPRLAPEGSSRVR
jgi:hypothetical protein